ncbi:hypothetical protein RCH09_003613 [Actimicrobium sp. GrIS 1.19]|nr:hypothetical protein [Actimicrobium sp. GrIS 1.19]
MRQASLKKEFTATRQHRRTWRLLRSELVIAASTGTSFGVADRPERVAPHRHGTLSAGAWQPASGRSSDQTWAAKSDAFTFSTAPTAQEKPGITRTNRRPSASPMTRRRDASTHLFERKPHHAHPTDPHRGRTCCRIARNRCTDPGRNGYAGRRSPRPTCKGRRGLRGRILCHAVTCHDAVAAAGFPGHVVLPLRLLSAMPSPAISR